MRVEIARHAGVCYGVERALRLAHEAASDASRPVHTLGPLIHNPQAVEELQAQGVEVVEQLDSIADGVVIIRSHGVDPAIVDAARRKGLEVIDATCPHVRKAHEAASELKARGYTVVIVGEAEHPEVEGIMAHAGGTAIVVESAQELPEHLPTNRVGVVVQTTQSVDRLREVVDALVGRVRELDVHNTICSATSRRQHAAAELATRVDVVVVVGGHNSGNTARLVEICRSVNPRTHVVETAEEIDLDWFVGASSAGVTAGASTPHAQMQGVIDAIAAIGDTT